MATIEGAGKVNILEYSSHACCTEAHDFLATYIFVDSIFLGSIFVIALLADQNCLLVNNKDVLWLISHHHN